MCLGYCTLRCKVDIRRLRVSRGGVVSASVLQAVVASAIDIVLMVRVFD